VTADGILLGRPRVRATRTATTQIQTATGSALARHLLGVAFFGAILFEVDTADRLMDLGTYLHRGIGSWTGLPVAVTPMELLLLLALAVATVSQLAKPRWISSTREELTARLRGGWPVLLFAVATVAGFIRGAVSGGDMYIGLWELRFLLYIPACYLIVRSSVRTPEHVAALLRTGLIATVFLAAEGAYRRIGLIDQGKLGVIPEFAYAHESVMFLASFTLLLLAAYVFGAFKRARTVGLLLAPLFLYTLLATERRAGIIVLLVGIIVTALVTVFVRRKAFILAALPVLVITAAYLVVFWNAPGIAGQAARAIKSISEPDQRDAASNLYRLLETFNIRATIHSDPLFGVGFGRPFLMVVGLPDLSWWPFWHFETHNNILWVWLKTGVLGYVLFWVMVGGAISRAAYAAKRLEDATLRCAALFCLIAVVGTVVFAWVDLGLVSGRVTIMLGIALGILAVVERIDLTSRRAAPVTR
jgi:O-antigen ligase